MWLATLAPAAAPLKLLLGARAPSPASATHSLAAFSEIGRTVEQSILAHDYSRFALKAGEGARVPSNELTDHHKVFFPAWLTLW